VVSQLINKLTKILILSWKLLNLGKRDLKDRSQTTPRTTEILFGSKILLKILKVITGCSNSSHKSQHQHWLEGRVGHGNFENKKIPKNPVTHAAHSCLKVTRYVHKIIEHVIKIYRTIFRWKVVFYLDDNKQLPLT